MQLLEIQRGAAWNIMYYQVVVEEIQGDTRSHTLTIHWSSPFAPPVLRYLAQSPSCEEDGRRASVREEEMRIVCGERDCEDERE